VATEHHAYQDRIITDPGILAGKPVVRGTRIPVELVLDHLAQNPDLGDLFAAYPRLTREDVQACLAYAIRERLPHAGIILFRLRATAFAVKRERLAVVLRDHVTQLDQFLVVTETTIRVRPL
jgi:uncharacterized protein (DUF433 family)